MTITQPSISKEPPRGNGQPSPPPKLPPSSDPPLPAPACLPDLTLLADEALAGLVEQGQAELTRRKEKKESDFLALVAETARTLGVTPARVAAAIANKGQRPRATSSSDGRSDVRPVYRDPVSGATWSGRGQAPPWVEFGDEVNPKTGKKLPLPKYRIAEQTK